MGELGEDGGGGVVSPILFPAINKEIKTFVYIPHEINIWNKKGKITKIIFNSLHLFNDTRTYIWFSSVITVKTYISKTDKSFFSCFAFKRIQEKMNKN